MKHLQTKVWILFQNMLSEFYFTLLISWKKNHSDQLYAVSKIPSVSKKKAKMDSQILCNLILIPFTKVASAHPSMSYFQIVGCHNRWDLQPSIHNPENVSHFLFGRIFKSVNFFLDTRYSGGFVISTLWYCRFSYDLQNKNKINLIK